MGGGGAVMHPAVTLAVESLIPNWEQVGSGLREQLLHLDMGPICLAR